MVNQEQVLDVQKALEFKERGNKFFLSGDYTAAEKCYSQAIKCDPLNHQLYTNRAMVFLKLTLYDKVITDTTNAITLHPNNQKAYYQLAQAQLATSYCTDALASAEKARKLCLDDLYAGRKSGNSIGPINELVLKCKKKNWEIQEKDREMKKFKLLRELQCGLDEKRDKELARLEAAGDQNDDSIENVRNKYLELSEELRRIWGMATGEKKRGVPDWCIDGITLTVMLDPVVTKSGQSYDRGSILEHLKRSETDPLTREPLRSEDLRPNLALRDACQEFLKENGWAVDW